MLSCYIQHGLYVESIEHGFQRSCLCCKLVLSIGTFFNKENFINLRQLYQGGAIELRFYLVSAYLRCTQPIKKREKDFTALRHLGWLNNGREAHAYAIRHSLHTDLRKIAGYLLSRHSKSVQIIRLVLVSWTPANKSVEVWGPIHIRIYLRCSIMIAKELINHANSMEVWVESYVFISKQGPFSQEWFWAQIFSRGQPHILPSRQPSYKWHDKTNLASGCAPVNLEK
jgi:hypothetical protein